MREAINKIGSFLLDTIQTVVLSLSIFVISYMFFFQPEKVIGASMLPTLRNSDFLIAEKISYRFGEPKRGDIVVIKAPASEPCSEQGCDYVKRIIGLPGEQIKINNNRIYINNVILNENYLSSGTMTRAGSYFKESITLGPNDYLVMGDNRSYSRDGRDFGPISHESIVGRIIHN